MRDLFTHLSPALLIASATLNADNTPLVVDLQGASSALVLLSVGIGGITFDGTNKIEFVLKHGDTATAGEHVAVTTGEVRLDSLGPASVVNGIIRSLVAAHAAGTVQRIGYTAGRRYLSLLADFSGTHGTGTPISAIVARGDLNLRPPV